MGHAETIWLALMVAGLIALGVLYLVLNACFIIRLRNEHPELWKSLGSPHPAPINSIKQCADLNRFIQRGVNVAISDVTILRQVYMLKLCGRVYLAFFLAIVILFAWSQLLR